MKRIFILAVLSLGLFASCKKSSSPGSSYSMTATVAGASKNFDSTLVATSQTALGVNTVSITGILSAATGESMILTLDNSPSGIPIIAGPYSDTSTLFNVTADYLPSLNVVYVAGTGVATLAGLVSIPIAHHFSLIITAINSTSIKGTFTGDFYANGDPTGTIKSITGGTFTAAFQ